jgi:hypothetical protein
MRILDFKCFFVIVRFNRPSRDAAEVNRQGSVCLFSLFSITNCNTYYSRNVSSVMLKIGPLGRSAEVGVTRVRAGLPVASC